ncbi:MAG: hypothetical protein COB66_07035 [Coxiella sp. (in: Bacteria)]|nr:MAG: hypothetical protein COB66_07035 [Coxiella sp. (in: g-proteobacteria)]
MLLHIILISLKFRQDQEPYHFLVQKQLSPRLGHYVTCYRAPCLFKKQILGNMFGASYHSVPGAICIQVFKGYLAPNGSWQQKMLVCVITLRPRSSYA